MASGKNAFVKFGHPWAERIEVPLPVSFHIQSKAGIIQRPAQRDRGAGQNKGDRFRDS